MTEAAATFNETVKERSIVKKSAAHKKNGSAVTKLGNKQLSWQEIASKHGECKSYDLKSFMSYEEFKLMPQDLQIRYVNSLCDKYDVGIKHLSRYLFELSDDDLRDYLRERGILNQCNPQKARTKFGLQYMRFDIEDWKKRERTLEAIDNMEKTEQFADFITYEDYMQMNKHDRAKYINHLIEKYHVSHCYISTILFGKSKDRVGCVARDNGTLHYIMKPDRGGMKLSEIKKRFEDAVNDWKASLAQYEPKQESTEETEPLFQPEEAPKVKEEIPVSEICEPVEEDTRDICDPNDFWHSIEPIPDTRSDPFPEPEKDPMEYHDVSFESNYVREGIDMDELFTISRLVQNKKVRVKFSVTVI